MPKSLSRRTALLATAVLAILMPVPAAHAASFSSPVRVAPSVSVRPSTYSAPKSSYSAPKTSFPSSSKITSKPNTVSVTKSAAKSIGKPSAASISKPSTGPKAQPAPATKLVPPTRPTTLSPSKIPAGRDYSRDRTFLVSHPTYLDPYSSMYYGLASSPYHYMYLASLASGMHPLAPQSYIVSGGSNAGEIAVAIVGGIIVAGILVVVALAMLDDRRAYRW